MTCESCGASTNGTGPLRHRVTCRDSVRNWFGPDSDHKRSADVTWPGGKTFENLGHEPKTFYSPAELNRYLKANRLESFVRHTPVPGTDKSPHTTSWAAVSQETLDGAKAMLERVGKGTKDEAPQTWIESMTVTVTDVPGFVTTPIGGLHAD